MNRFLLNTVLVAVVMAPQSLSVANAQSKDDKSELEFSIGAATVVGGTGLGIDSIRTTRNGKQVITSASFAGNKDGARAEIRIWDTAKKSETGVITTDIEQIVTLAIDPAGKRLTAITGEDEVVSWTINDGRLLFRTAASEYPRGGLLYSPDGNVLLVGGVDVSALNPMTGQLLAETEMQNDQFAADIAAAGNGEFLALATDEGVVISDSRTMQTQLFLATEE
ncbi:MAG: WD40 repeat domain-containing protein, partial [Planctomycetaceae bacterium]|nr:WD40 repeat domain-containing protein [Planctomycetaceae bacterium]